MVKYGVKSFYFETRKEAEVFAKRNVGYVDKMLNGKYKVTVQILLKG